MKQSIPLAQPGQNNGSAVHSVALTLFSWARSAAALAAEVPGLAEQAADDIAKAWHESAQRPKL